MKSNQWKAIGLTAFGLITISAIAVVFTLIASAGNPKGAQAQTTPAPTTNPRIITVNVTGQIQAPPDVAYLNLGVAVSAPTAREALDKANASGEKIRQAIIDAGIPAQDVRVTSTGVYADQSKAPGQPNTDPTSYRASVDFTVTINDLSKAGAVLDAATNAGANQVSGVSYGIKDDSKLRAQALETAVKQAQPKAEAMARGLNVQVGQVVRVEEGGSYAVPLPYGAGASANIQNPGQLTVTVQAIVTFAIV